MSSNIFDRFYQVDSFQRGVGLSLTLSKRMMDLLVGKMKVESVEGKGAIFYLEIPVNYKEIESEVSEIHNEFEFF